MLHALVQILALLLGNCFNDIIALLGSIGFAPLTVYFPVSHHILVACSSSIALNVL